MRRTLGLIIAALCLAVPAARTLLPVVSGAAADARFLHPLADRGGCKPGAPAAARFLHPLADRGGCKPGAPVAVELQQSGAHDGSVVELAFSISTHAGCDAVTWRLQLPDGAQLLAGASEGTLAPGASDSGLLHASVRLSPDAGFSQVLLCADGRLGPDGPGAPSSVTESVQSRRTLSWGRPPLAVPERTRIDPETGASERFAALTVRHRTGSGR